MAKIKSGNPSRGREAVGEAHDTEGSRWIIVCADGPDPRPLNIVIWGGLGGRFQRDRTGVWRDALDTVDGKTEARLSVSRWRPDAEDPR